MTKIIRDIELAPPLPDFDADDSIHIAFAVQVLLDNDWIHVHRNGMGKEISVTISNPENRDGYEQVIWQYPET